MSISAQRHEPSASAISPSEIRLLKACVSGGAAHAHPWSPPVAHRAPTTSAPLACAQAASQLQRRGLHRHPRRLRRRYSRPARPRNASPAACPRVASRARAAGRRRSSSRTCTCSEHGGSRLRIAATHGAAERRPPRHCVDENVNCDGGDSSGDCPSGRNNSAKIIRKN